MPSEKKTNYKTSGMAFMVMGITFMPTINVALGAAFLAIGAAFIAKHKGEDADAARLEDGDES